MKEENLNAKIIKQINYENSFVKKFLDKTHTLSAKIMEKRGLKFGQ
jgi:hypothetical protein